VQVRVKSVGMGRVWVYTVCYPDTIRYTIVIWSRKSRHETWGGWSVQKTKGPEYK